MNVLNKLCEEIFCVSNLEFGKLLLKRLNGEQRFKFQNEEVTEKYCCVNVNQHIVVKQLDHGCETWSQKTDNCEESKNLAVLYKKDRSY